MRGLTGRQRQLLEFIAGHIRENGYPPTLREMAAELGVRSPNGVNDHLKALERKGYILRQAGPKSRAISLARPVLPPAAAGDERDTIEVPLLGRVAAGLPVLAEENFERRLHIDAGLLPASGRVFALRVHGDSMVGRGILDGDIVLVRAQSTAHSGDVVVALVDGEATVKTLRRNRQVVVLEPANPDFAPIVLDGHQARNTTIVGVVVGLWRRIG